jgi:hypothetical protein
MSQSTYFGSHNSPGGKVKPADSSELLKALKIQTIQNANKTSKIVPGVTSETPATRVINTVQYNPTYQQVRYGVWYTAPTL